MQEPAETSTVRVTSDFWSRDIHDLLVAIFALARRLLSALLLAMARAPGARWPASFSPDDAPGSRDLQACFERILNRGLLGAGTPGIIVVGDPKFAPGRT